MAKKITFESLIKQIIEVHNIESKAKNKAYAFILENRQLEEFREFCCQNKDIDPHELCIEKIELNATLKKAGIK